MIVNNRESDDAYLEGYIKQGMPDGYDNTNSYKCVHGESG